LVSCMRLGQAPKMQHLYTLLVWLLSLAPAMQASLVWMTASVARPVSSDAKVASKPGSSDRRSIRVSLEPGSHESAPAEPGREDTSQGASCGKPIMPLINQTVAFMGVAASSAAVARCGGEANSIETPAHFPDSAYMFER
jgi:hypothetical protein